MTNDSTMIPAFVFDMYRDTDNSTVTFGNMEVSNETNDYFNSSGSGFWRLDIQNIWIGETKISWDVDAERYAYIDSSSPSLIVD